MNYFYDCVKTFLFDVFHQVNIVTHIKYTSEYEINNKY